MYSIIFTILVERVTYPLNDRIEEMRNNNMVFRCRVETRHGPHVHLVD